MFGRLIIWIFVLILTAYGCFVKGLPLDEDKIKVYVETSVPKKFNMGKIRLEYEFNSSLTSLEQYEENIRPEITGYKDCNDVPTSKGTGVYNISIGSLYKEIYCGINSDGTKYTVIQRRFNGSQNFFKNWTEYENGFGDLQYEFWIGNKVLYHLTSKANYKLRVDLVANDSTKAYAEYERFSVGSPEGKYKLHVAGYSGDAGDSLTFHSGQMFSTFDNDNDMHATNCALLYLGAWWYKNCHMSNLNGHYYGGSHRSYADGMEWKTFKGFNESMIMTTMKIYKLSI